MPESRNHQPPHSDRAPPHAPHQRHASTILLAPPDHEGKPVPLHGTTLSARAHGSHKGSKKARRLSDPSARAQTGRTQEIPPRSQRWSSDDGCPPKGQPSPALKLQPGARPAPSTTLGEPRLGATRNPPQRTTRAEQQSSTAPSSALGLSSVLSALGFSDRLQIQIQKQGQLLSTRKTSARHLSPCGLLPSVLLAAQFSLSTAPPGGDPSPLRSLAAGQTPGQETDNPLLPSVCIPQDAAAAYAKRSLPCLPISPLQPQPGLARALPPLRSHLRWGGSALWPGPGPGPPHPPTSSKRRRSEC